MTTFHGYLRCALVAALIAAAPATAWAAMTKEQVAAKIEKDFGVKVLRIEPATADGKAIFAVRVMSGGGNWNHAFQVNTIAVDAATGEPVVQHRQSDGQMRYGPPPVQERGGIMTEADK